MTPRPFLHRRSQVILLVVVSAWFAAYLPVIISAAVADRVMRGRG